MNRAFLLGSVFFILTQSTFSKTINFSAFNIRWYGMGGEGPERNAKEFRDPELTRFFNESKLAEQDVLGFEEIVDVEGLKKLLPKHRCVSYEHSVPTHQHVVLCAKKPYQLALDGGDDNFALEAATLDMPERLRPPVHAALADEKGKVLAHFIVVHLKAQPAESARRLAQVEIIEQFVRERLPTKEPVVLMGDFNTHRAELTKGGQDDAKKMDAIFSKSNRGFSRNIDNNLNTYCGRKGCSQLDQIWADSSAQLSRLDTWAVCKNNGAGGSGFKNKDYYYKNVSDHCPVFSSIVVSD